MKKYTLKILLQKVTVLRAISRCMERVEHKELYENAARHIQMWQRHHAWNPNSRLVSQLHKGWEEKTKQYLTIY